MSLPRHSSQLMNHEGKVSEAAQGMPVEAAPSVDVDVKPAADEAVARSAPKGASGKPARKLKPNSLKKFREAQCLSQAELARRANLSALTIARIEKGFGCRMSTKRKILEALGLSLADRIKVFGEEE